MEVQEISSRLDYALQKAKGGLVLDEYTKSIYLTKAQALFVESVLAQYEYGDALRHVLGSMIVEVTETTFSDEGTNKKGVIPKTDIKSILFEQVNDSIETIPLDYNDIHDANENPFRKPYKKLVYRITGNKKLTIFSTENVAKYFYIYCKEPSPIVLENIPTEISINGVSTATTSELPYDSTLKVISLTVSEILKDIQILQPPQKEVQQK